MHKRAKAFISRHHQEIIIAESHYSADHIPCVYQVAAVLPLNCSARLLGHTVKTAIEACQKIDLTSKELFQAWVTGKRQNEVLARAQAATRDEFDAHYYPITVEKKDKHFWLKVPRSKYVMMDPQSIPSVPTDETLGLLLANIISILPLRIE